MSGAHVIDRIPDLLVRAEDDPRRRVAAAHLAVCPGCRAAWAESEALFAVLDEAASPPAPRPEVQTSVTRTIEDQGFASSPLGARAKGLLSLLVAAVGVAPVVVTAMRAHGEGAATAAALAVAAACLAGLALARPRAALLVPLFSLGLTVAFGRTFVAHFDLGHSFRCARFELIVASVPTLALALRLRGRRARPRLAPTWAAAGLAGAGAAAGQAALHLMCPMEASLTHQLLFHVVPLVGVMLVVGLTFARRNRRALLGPVDHERETVPG